MKDRLFKLLFPAKEKEISRLKLTIEQGEEKTAHLQDDLRELALRPESFRSSNIEHAIRFQHDSEKAFWFGSREAATNETPQ